MASNGGARGGSSGSFDSGGVNILDKKVQGESQTDTKGGGIALWESRGRSLLTSRKEFVWGGGTSIR